MSKIDLIFKLEFISYLDHNRVYALELRCESLFMVQCGFIYDKCQTALKKLNFEEAFVFRNDGYINLN